MARPAVTVRPLVKDDLDAVMSIEDAAFVQPWSRSLFDEELAQPTRRYLVAELDGSIVAYGGLMLVGEDAHLLTVAVEDSLRRSGLASYLLTELVALAQAGGARHITLEVRESNAAAQALYGKFGFESAGKRKGYYTTEDAVVMWAIDIDSAQYQDALATIRREAS